MEDAGLSTRCLFIWASTKMVRVPVSTPRGTTGATTWLTARPIQGIVESASVALTAGIGAVMMKTTMTGAVAVTVTVRVVLARGPGARVGAIALGGACHVRLIRRPPVRVSHAWRTATVVAAMDGAALPFHLEFHPLLQRYCKSRVLTVMCKPVPRRWSQLGSQPAWR